MGAFRLLFFLIGILIVYVGAKGFLDERKTTSGCTEKLTGTVVENEESVRYTHNEKPKPYTEYIPVISYNFGNRSYRYTCENGYSERPRKLGKKVEILIAPENPEKAFVPEWEDNGIIPFVICIALGIFWCIVSLI